MLCFFISSFCILILLSETFSLINRVIQLGICITHFPCIDKQLKTFYFFRIVWFLFSKWGDRQWMIHNKGWLDQVLFTIFLKEQVDDITLGMTFFKFNTTILCQCFCFFIRLDLIKVYTSVFLNGIVHSQTCKWLAKVDLDSIVSELAAAQYSLSQIAEHGLCQFHHAFIICICLV